MKHNAHGVYPHNLGKRGRAMKNLTIICFTLLLITGCRKKEYIPTYKIYERFTLYHGHEAIVEDTTVFPSVKYKVLFDDIVGEGRPNEECCSDCERGQVVVRLHITNEAGEKVTDKGYYGGCVSGEGTPFSIWTSNIPAHGVILKCMAVKPHPKENTTIVLHEYNVNLVLWK